MKQDSTMRYVKQQIWKQRIGYGVSDFACNLIWQMISLYLLYFYTDVMSLSAKSIAFMFVVTRFIDGGTDLLIGYCIDHTRTRWGKSRPYFLFGAIPFALFAVLAFSVPDISQSGKLIYAYVTYIGLSFTYTVVNIPMASILPSLTTDTQERTALSTTRKFFAFLGSTVVSSTALKLVDSLGKGSEALGFRIVMIIFGFIGCLLFFFTFATVKERVNTAAESVSLKESLMSLGKNKPWLIFALNIIFMWTGFFLQTSAIVYYYTAVIGSKELSVTIATIMSIVPMAATPNPEARQSGWQAGYTSVPSFRCPLLSLPQHPPCACLLCFPDVSAPHISSCKPWLSHLAEGSPFEYWYPPSAP